MRRVIACVVLFGSVIGGGWLLSRGWPLWWVGLMVVAIDAWALRLSMCPHSGPLGLLPATTRLDGTPNPALWFCSDCGKTWPANFEKQTQPIQKFSGYDEAKAVAGARRAGNTTAQMAEQDRLAKAKKSPLRKVSNG